VAQPWLETIPRYYFFLKKKRCSRSCTSLPPDWPNDVNTIGPFERMTILHDRSIILSSSLVPQEKHMAKFEDKLHKING
jgi:hypothetical protein